MRFKWLPVITLLVLLALPGCAIVRMEHGAIPVTTTISPDAVHVPIQVQIDTAELAKVVNAGIKDIAYVAIAVIAIGSLSVCWFIHRRSEARVKEMREMTRPPPAV